MAICMVLRMGNRNVVQPPEEIVGATAGAGRWQLLVTFVLSVVIFMHMLNNTVETLPVAGSYWCRKPRNLESWSEIDWVFYSHVGAEDNKERTKELIAHGLYKGCRIYKFDYESLGSYEKRPKIWTEESIGCPYSVRYATHSGHSIAEKFKKGCDEAFENSPVWKSANMIGAAIGYVVFGVLADHIGRKRVIFISCGITPIITIVLTLTSSYEHFIALRTLLGFFHGGFVLCYVLVAEISINAWRTRLLGVACIFHAVAIVVTSYVVRLFGTISQMLLFINVPYIVFFVSAEFLPESPSWLCCTRDTTRLQTVIANAAKINGTSLPNFHVIYIEYLDERQRMPKKRPQIWNVLFEPDIACEIFGYTYLTALLGIAQGTSHHSITTTTMTSRNAYVLVGTSMTVGLVSGQFLVLLMGHRKTLQISIALVFIAFSLLMLKLHHQVSSITGPKLTLLMGNVALISLCSGALLSYGSRTIPTLLRGTFFGIWRASWMMSKFAGSYLLGFPEILTVSIVISFLLAGLFTLNLRDLLNRELPDTVHDSINFKDKPKPKRWAISEVHTTSTLKQVVHVNLEQPSKVMIQQSVSQPQALTLKSSTRRKANMPDNRLTGLSSQI